MTEPVRPQADTAEGLPEDADRVIGALLGDARQAAGLPQSEVARRTGVAQSRIARIELGQRRLLFTEAITLCDLYAISLEQLDPRRIQPRARGPRRKRVDLPRTSRTGEPA